MRIARQSDGTFMVDGHRFPNEDDACEYVANNPRPDSKGNEDPQTPAPPGMGSFMVILGMSLLAFVSGAIGRGNNGIAAVFAIVFVLSAVFVYFSPTWVAHLGAHPQCTAITILNVLLGWTVIGWVAALVWSYRRETPAAVHSSDRVAPKSITEQPSGTPAIASADEKTCPFCAETIKAAAIKCKHCGSELARPTAAGVT